MLERTIREITGEQQLLRVHGEDSGVNAALVVANRRTPHVTHSMNKSPQGIGSPAVISSSPLT